MPTETSHNSRDDEKTKSNIEKYGLTVIIVEATEYLPSFAYTVGLWEKLKHPEIICFGFSTKMLHGIINDVADIIKSGTRILPNKKYDNFFKNSETEFINVNPSFLPNYFGVAIDYYQTRDFPAMQLIWKDRNNKFPWEDNFEEEFIYKQPLLDRNTEFKFREAKNLGIFTTDQWLNKGKPIIKVVHDDDGDWQFLTGDHTLGDACIVCLEDMTKKDLTLNELFNLDYGEEANRNFIGDLWVRRKSEKEEDDNEYLD